MKQDPPHQLIRLQKYSLHFRPIDDKRMSLSISNEENRNYYRNDLVHLENINLKGFEMAILGDKFMSILF